jgi:class 3 adenylate cyclase/tetratricopeptide (TPR) repeat protein
MQQLDLEEYYEMLQAYQRTCTQILQRFGGYLAQYRGEELLAYFGYPQAYDDASQRAVHAALDMVQAVALQQDQLRQEHGVQYTLRVGLHTGLVIVAQLDTQPSHNRFALGAVPHRAVQIQRLAPPNAVVISAATTRLIQGYFVCQEVAGQTLKGPTSSMRLWQVLQASGARHRLDVATSLTPLVGRDGEVALLREHWKRVQEGMGQVALLVGEGGIGKSRLVHTLQESLAAVPHLWLEYHCVPYHQQTVLQPLLTWFQRTLDWQSDDTPEAKLHKIETALMQYQLSVKETVPLFASLLSVALPEERYGPSALPLQRQQALDAFVTILLTQAVSQPVVLLVEDLHWSDPITLDLLTVLVDQVPTVPLYLLLTCRPEFQPSWRQHSYVTQLTLNRLSRAHGVQIIASMVRGKRLPTEILQLIEARAEGNPLFLEELAKTVLESGLLRETLDHYELTAPLPSFAVPATVHDALLARLDRLGTAKGLAQWGATIGRQFSYEFLQAVTQRDDVTCQRELRTLVEAELLYQRGIGPQATYSFKHPLVQDVAYQSLLRQVRQHYHYTIAQTLVRLHRISASAHVFDIAHHLIEAGPLADAPLVIEYTRRAGDYAFSMFDWPRTVHYYTALCTAAAAHGELAATILAEVHYRMGLALARDGRVDDSVEHYDQAIAIYQRLGDLHGQVRTLMTKTLGIANASYGTLVDTRPLEVLLDQLGDQESALHGNLAIALSEIYWVGRRPETAEAMARRAVAIGQQFGDHQLSARASFNLALALVQNLRLQAAVEAYRQSYAYAQLANDAWLAGWPLQRLATTLIMQGQFDEVHAVAQEASDVAAQTNNWGHHGLTLAALTTMSVAQGDFDAAERYGQETMMYVSRYRFPYGGALALPALAGAHAWRGAWQQAHETLDLLIEPGRVFARPAPVFHTLVRVYRQLVQIYESIGTMRQDDTLAPMNDMAITGPCDITSLPLYCALVELSVYRSQPATAAQCYQVLASVVDQGVLFSRGWVFLLPRLLGLAASLNRWWDQAEALFQTALTTATETGAQPERGRVYLDYACMLLARGQERDYSQGFELLQKARLLLSQLGMEPFVRHSERVIKERCP